MRPSRFAAAALLIGLAAAPARAQERGGGEVTVPTDEISSADRAAIRVDLDAAQVRLGLALPDAAGKRGAATRFAWPIAPAGTFDGTATFPVSAFFDHDGVSGTDQDYTCTDRSYDGHEGTDIITWPFPLARMDANEVVAVAAAPGVIIGTRDGNFDRQCAAVTGAQWNAVYLRHDDGAVTWYGHLKSGSLTAKAVGQRVETGERLGVIGSSGRSTGPHLHFEVYDASGGLIDPFGGTCNRRNGQTSWWIAQPPPRETAISAVRTHSVPPLVRTCPQTETISEKRSFAAGESFKMAVYLRDQAPDQVLTYRILDPTGATFWSDTQVMRATYTTSYWYVTVDLPPNAASGVWKAVAEIDGKMVARDFAVGTVLAGEETTRAGAVRIGTPWPNPATAAVTMDVDAPSGKPVTVDAYDVLGRHLARLHDGDSGTLAFDASALPRGLVMLRVTAGAHIETRRLVLR